MTLLTLSQLGVKRGPCAVLHDVSLSVAPGEFIGLIGPNGAGKTTLMRAALGLIASSGISNLAALPPSRRATLAAWLPQLREVAWPIAVADLVALGRMPHGGAKTPADQAAIATAMRRMDLDNFATRRATELSGGELARVLIARALAQETPLLLADEPIAGLDPAHQITAMKTFRALADEGRAVIASLHDLGLAARHCTRLVLLGHGTVQADGPPAAVLTAENLARVFGVTAYFAQTESGPVFQPIEVVA